jgi:Zn-dependent peptidase ImmA (M78 family)/DNA-binding XRE family transcriptional regulator
MVARAPIEPSVLVWARETAGMSQDQAAMALGVPSAQVRKWETGDLHPTMGQLRTIAEKYRRPLGTFLLREPPQEAAQTPHDFRHLAGGIPAAKSPALIAQLRLAANRRVQALELYDELGERPPVFSLMATVDESADVVAERVRAFLNVSLDEQRRWRTPEVALAAWKEAFEAAGVLVFQFSKLDVTQMRGVSLADLPLPVIITNAKDSPSARVFTLFHELAHLALRSSGLCDLDQGDTRPPEEQRTEVFCNAIAAAALVPKRALLSLPYVRARPGVTIEWTDDEIDQIRREFGVSRFVVLRRLVATDRASQHYYGKRHDVWGDEFAALQQKDTGKPVIVPPFRSSLASNGKQFARLVLRAYYDDRITLSDVSEYLRLKVRHVPAIERELFR